MRFELEKCRDAAKKGDTGAFIRGFFCALEHWDIESAVLHGWQNAFEGLLSDVDFVLARAEFNRVANLVARYCQEVGWQLCQVLRHETTAAFCVCAWAGDPSVVVALDACSDYRRQGRILIPAEELLKGKLHMPSGGFRISESNELHYVFLKGAVKQKNPIDLAPVLAAYADEVRAGCSRWLQERWSLEFNDWSAAGVAAAWRILDGKIMKERAQDGWKNFGRVFGRLTRPTGLIIEGDHDVDALIGTFGRLYFRRSASINHWKLTCLKSLASSTLLSVQHLGCLWKFAIPRDLWLKSRSGETSAELNERVMDLLKHRCARRENLRVS